MSIPKEVGRPSPSSGPVVPVGPGDRNGLNDAVIPDPSATKTAGNNRHRPRRRSLSRSVWFSRQHGGWSMTVVPVLVGSIMGGLTWWQALLAGSWLIAFLTFDALGAWIQAVSPKRRRDGTKTAPRWARGKRYLLPIAVYGVLALSGAVVLLVTHPFLAWYALPITPLFLVAVLEMWRGEPRSFLARLTSIVASCLLAPIAFQLGAHPFDWRSIWLATIILVAYFVGTIAYVKTMIRERGNRWWLSFSISYHITFAALTLIGALTRLTTWWLFGVAVILAVRAWVFPFVQERRGRPLKPVVFGIAEFVFSALVVLAILLPG